MAHPSLPITREQPPALRPHPSKLFVEVTTRCNLHCAMCVRESGGQRIVEGDMNRETFARLAPAFPRLDALVLNGIGEPLLNRDLERFIELARRDMPAAGWVGFQTNGQLLGPRRAESLAGAGVDRICISADAVSPEVFASLRRGGRHEAIESAAAALHEAGRRRGRPIALGLEFVAMQDNVPQLPDLVRWAARNHIGFVIVTHMLPYGKEAVGAVAFDSSTDRARRIFGGWQERAVADGVDMGRYFKIFLKFRPTPEDARVIDYVRRMVADASAQGVSLNLAKLLRFDESMLRRVEEAFGHAKEIAQREGVDLELPAVTPTADRRCEFVEGGGCFVSWDGDVHPCYFLWHRYSCHVAGIVKNVVPKSFGRLSDRDVLSVWNDRPARSFREGVLRYDFPFCYDCNHALCDHVQDGEFTEDCHLSTVPCAACLWCTGVFQCLQ
ncbi:MAG TPA: radical SAM/SPASM family putative metalloenzyme maturase [Anaeromyxobacteraceae bacterium]